MKFAMLALLTLLPAAAWAGPAEDMIATDTAFAKMSVEKGQAAAFLAYMNDDARLFGDGGEPVIGRKAAEAKYSSDQFKNSGSAKGTLDWKPVEALAATDGSMGWTNGHWTFTSAPDEKGQHATSHGHYVTIWRKNKTGAWKVEADIGTVDAETK